MENLPHPILNNDGTISEEKVFKLAIGTLKLNPSLLDDLTLEQLIWLYENDVETKLDHYETLSTAFAFGYISAKKGKKISMFEKPKQAKIKRISREEKEKEMEYLNSTFS